MEYASFFLNTFIALLVIVDPFALLPVYISLTERFTKEEQKRTIHKSMIASTVLLFVFAITVLGFFKFFGITLPAFQIAGGFLLMYIGIDQLNLKRERMDKEEEEESHEKEDISIFPLAMPLMAGPGAISTVVLMTTQITAKENYSILFSILFVAILLVMLVCYLTLSASSILMKLLGKTGLNLVSKLMGIVICAIAVQFVINGVEHLLIEYNLIQK